MKFALSVPQWGAYADARLLAGLAREAEQAGWDGFFLWDDVVWGLDGPPMADVTVALAAIALSTERIRFGPMVTPLPRRRPVKVAREVATLDHLANGRFILGVGTGSGVSEFDNLGEETNHRTRGEMLDEGLGLLRQIWSGEPVNHEGKFYTVKESLFTPTPVQNPLPIWGAATWPTKTELKNDVPFRRAARLDGVFPIPRDLDWADALPAADIARIVDMVRSYRNSDAPFDVATGANTTRNADQDAEQVAAYEAAGLTWWVENLMPMRFGWKWAGPWPLEQMHDLVLQGPPVKA